MAKKIRMLLRKLEYKLEDSYDYLYNETLINAGRAVIDILVTSVTLFYAITGMMPIVPQWVWFGIFLFMLVAGTLSLEDLLNTGYDEDGNKIMDDDDEVDEPEEGEIIEG